MTSRSILILLLLATSGIVPANASRCDGDDTNGGKDESKNPMITCSIRTYRVDWHLRSEDARVVVEIVFQGSSQITALPSLHLIAVSKTEGPIQEEYWAPFDLTTGSILKKKQKVQPTGELHPRSVRLFPSRLLWASTKSSVWPSQSFTKTVPRGRYRLRVQIELENGKSVSSNEVEINVTE